MKKRMMAAVIGLSVAAGAVIGIGAGKLAFIQPQSSAASNSMPMGSMMSNSGMDGMMNGMMHSDMNKMMEDAQSSPEGQAMIESCHAFMDSYEEDDVNTKQTAL